jgi:hypothetical protein
MPAYPLGPPTSHSPSLQTLRKLSSASEAVQLGPARVLACWEMLSSHQEVVIGLIQASGIHQ